MPFVDGRLIFVNFPHVPGRFYYGEGKLSAAQMVNGNGCKEFAKPLKFNKLIWAGVCGGDAGFVLEIKLVAITASWRRATVSQTRSVAVTLNRCVALPFYPHDRWAARPPSRTPARRSPDRKGSTRHAGADTVLVYPGPSPRTRAPSGRRWCADQRLPLLPAATDQLGSRNLEFGQWPRYVAADRTDQWPHLDADRHGR